MSEFTEGPAYRETCKYCVNYAMRKNKGVCYNVSSLRFNLFGPKRVKPDHTCKKFALHEKYKTR